MNLFREINARGTTVVVATHDRELIRRVGRALGDARSRPDRRGDAVMRALRYFFVEAGRQPLAAARRRRRRDADDRGRHVRARLLPGRSTRTCSAWSDAGASRRSCRSICSDDATAEQLGMVDELMADSGLAAHREYVSKEQAPARFQPGLSGPGGRGRAARDAIRFPPRSRCRLKPEVREAGAAVDWLATTLGGDAGRRRRPLRPPMAEPPERRRPVRCGASASVIVAMLAVASAMTVGQRRPAGGVGAA